MSKSWDRCYTLEDHFLYFLDCQLATVVDLEMLKSTPKSRLERHRSIARKMIDAGRAHKVAGLEDMSRVKDFESVYENRTGE